MKTIVIAVAVLLSLAGGAVNAVEVSYRYELIEGSRIVDDCAVCGRPPIVQELRGTFDLRRLQTDPLISIYRVENVDFKAADYKVAGSGGLMIGGEVALTQSMWLTGQVSMSWTNLHASFTNKTVVVERWWPMLKVSIEQTNGNDFQRFTIDIVAAPIREIWFSTASLFHAGTLPENANLVSAGDLLGSSGRIIKRNLELFNGLPVPVSEEMGLDAIDMQEGADIAISTETNGMAAGEGDVFHARSMVVFTEKEILAPLLQGQTAEGGLDALNMEGAGASLRVYFSIERDIRIFNDPLPNVDLRKGDVLWVNSPQNEVREGGVLKKNAELLLRFDPADREKDYGLDALYMWRSGEIWFSTEEGFQDKLLGAVTAGDLLSDQGYVVYRNLELLERFAPIEDASSFGLDGLYVVSDAARADVDGARLQVQIDAAGPLLKWSGPARVFQAERADSLLQPFADLTPILPELQVVDTNGVSGSQRFYRLRQW